MKTPDMMLLSMAFDLARSTDVPDSGGIPKKHKRCRKNGGKKPERKNGASSGKRGAR